MNFTMIVELVGGLGLFLYGMSVMSEALQRVAGVKLRKFLRTLTQNRFAGVVTGLTITAVIQSSSATTVMLVGFVNAGLLNLTQSVGVIMGANIGTTVTGWLVALLGFKIKIATLALPAIGVGFFARFTGRRKFMDWGFVLLGFGLLFLGLTFMKDSVGELRNNPAIMEWLSGVHVTGRFSFLVAVLVGAAVTMLIQSSSATMALTMTIAGQGLIDFPTAAALLLGENIGTTITANLAAIGTGSAARQTARAHMIFNVAGVLGMLIYFDLILRFVDWMVPGTAIGPDPLAVAGAVPDHMAAFHTTFNIMNTLLFLPLVPLLVRLSRAVVRDEEDDKPLPTTLQFIRSDLMATPGLALEEARQTLNYMGKRSLEGIDTVIELLLNPEHNDYDRKSKEVVSIEQEMDDYEENLTHFLTKLTLDRISPRVSREISAISGSAHDYERIGDQLRSLLYLVDRRNRKGLEFPAEAVNEIRELVTDVHDIVQLVTWGIIEPSKNLLRDAHVLEDGINRRRRDLRKLHIKWLAKNEIDPKAGILVIEVLARFEKIGDHAFNIAEDFAPEDQT